MEEAGETERREETNVVHGRQLSTRSIVFGVASPTTSVVRALARCMIRQKYVTYSPPPPPAPKVSFLVSSSFTEATEAAPSATPKNAAESVMTWVGVLSSVIDRPQSVGISAAVDRGYNAVVKPRMMMFCPPPPPGASP